MYLNKSYIIERLIEGQLSILKDSFYSLGKIDKVITLLYYLLYIYNIDNNSLEIQASLYSKFTNQQAITSFLYNSYLTSKEIRIDTKDIEY